MRRHPTLALSALPPFCAAARAAEHHREYDGFAVRRGRRDLVEKRNRGIRAVRASGEETRPLDTWMGAAR